MPTRKVIVVTHADLADGLKSSIEFFTGDKYEVTAICAFTKSNDVQEQLAAYFENLDEGDEVLGFTDILFGSVNQWISIYKLRPHTHIFSGTNVPLLLSLLLKPDDEYLSEEEIQNAVAECSSSIVYVNSLVVEQSEDDE